MLTEITNHKIGLNNEKIKIGNYYVGFSERTGFTLQICLGLVKKTLNTTYSYYTLGPIKGVAQRVSRSYRYYIDFDYMKKILDFSIEAMLNNRLEPEFFNITDMQLFNIGDSLNMDIINNWYIKNKLMNQKLPELYTNVPQKVKKRDLEVGRIYTNYQGTEYYVYIGYLNDGYCLYNLDNYIMNRIGIDNFIKNSLIQNVAKFRGYDNLSKEHFIENYTTIKKTLPKLYILDENFVTANGTTKFLGKHNKIAIF